MLVLLRVVRRRPNRPYVVRIAFSDGHESRRRRAILTHAGRRIMTGRDVVDAVVRLGFDRQAAPLEAFLSTCVEKRRGENKVKRAKRAKVVAAQAAAAATEEPAAPAQPPLGPALLGPQPI